MDISDIKIRLSTAVNQLIGGPKIFDPEELVRQLNVCEADLREKAKLRRGQVLTAAGGASPAMTSPFHKASIFAGDAARSLRMGDSRAAINNLQSALAELRRAEAA